MVTKPVNGSLLACRAQNFCPDFHRSRIVSKLAREGAPDSSMACPSPVNSHDFVPGLLFPKPPAMHLLDISCASVVPENELVVSHITGIYATGAESIDVVVSMYMM